MTLIKLSPPMFSPPMFSSQFPLPLPIPVVTMDCNTSGFDIDILRLKGRRESKNKSGTT